MKASFAIPVFVFFCTFWLGPALAQNPFLAPPSLERKEDLDGNRRDQDRLEQQTRVGQGALTRPRAAVPFFSKIAAMQRELRQKMTNHARQLKEKPLGSATWQLMGLSLLYGIIHAMGPGHGKSIVCSYFLSRRGTLKQALAFGNLIAAIHIISAVVIVLALSWFVGRANIIAFHSVEGRLESISYLLIMLIGMFLLGKTLLDWCKTPREDPETYSRATTKDMLSLSLASGLMPCPGAALILLFTLSLDVFWVGLLAMLPLALGMGLTTSAMGCATVGSTGLALNFSRRSKRTFILVHRTLACLGAAAIAALGAILFFGARFS